MVCFDAGLSSATAYVCAAPAAISLSSAHLPSVVKTKPAIRLSLSTIGFAAAESNGAVHTYSRPLRRGPRALSVGAASGGSVRAAAPPPRRGGGSCMRRASPPDGYQGRARRPESAPARGLSSPPPPAV